MPHSNESPLILIVEDHDAFRSMVQSILTDAGYRVIPATSGQSGLALARDHTPDLIITDLRMPGMSGHEFIERLKQEPEFVDTPVIVLSALTDPADTRRAMNHGADDYITKPVNAEDLLRSVAARLEKKELVEELNAFAHTVAHDLRSPISLAMGRLDLAATRLAQNDLVSLQEQLGQARQAVDRLNTIVGELLLLAKVRKSSITHESLDMSAIVTEALKRAEDQLRAANACVHQPDTWPTALGYAPWLIHVWSNLLTNAAKYGGTPPRIELSGVENPATGRVRFTVRDHGPGLDPQTAAGTFTPFGKIPQQRGRGHGLGLSIVRQIITKLNGSCGVESQPGQGAAFWFELRAAPVDADPVAIVEPPLADETVPA